jgi:LacI family transcriptional regulator
VLDIIEQSGYRPNQVAKSLRMKKTNNIGVLVEDIMGFSTPSIINGISEFVEQSGYHILLNDLRMLDSLFNRYDQIMQQKDKLNEAVSLLVYGAKVDAVIYVGMFDRDVSGIIKDIGKPLIIAYSTSDDEHTCSVTYENEEIAAQAARYLIDSGHERVAVITGVAHTSPARQRMKGVHTAFREAGLVLDNALVKNGDWEYASGYSCMEELLEQKDGARPTALFAMNDLMAIGAMDAITDAGLSVPDDISVIGFDNREISSLVRPKLTTAEIDLRGIGYAAAQMAYHKLCGQGEYARQRSVVIPSKLVLRNSVANI